MPLRIPNDCKHYRKNCELTQQEVAEAARISDYANIEGSPRGGWKLPTADELERIARVLNVPRTLLYDPLALDLIDRYSKRGAD